MNKSINIGNRLVGSGHPPFIVAEMSGNHNQSLDKALAIVEAAAEAGVHAVKLQTYTADAITIDIKRGEFFIEYPESLWKGRTLYELYKQAYTPWEWHSPIFDRCKELGLIAFSTPFDETAVDFLESLNVPAYKIASFENIHLPLIKKTAATKKPLIISAGMASVSELDDAVTAARQTGCEDIILLKCTSTYPSTPEDINLLTLPHMRYLFNVETGLSDHTLGIGVAVASVALGANVIEKHFTIRRSDGGVDAAFSIEPSEMKQLVHETFNAWRALGNINYESTEKEKAYLKFRRSIYIVEDIKKGGEFTAKNIKIIRPGSGLPPKCYDILIGKKASCDLKRGTPMSWDFIV